MINEKKSKEVQEVYSASHPKKFNDLQKWQELEDWIDENKDDKEFRCEKCKTEFCTYEEVYIGVEELKQKIKELKEK